MSEAIQIVPKIVRWGLRHGSENAKFGKFFGGKRGGKGQNSNSHGKPKTMARLLVEQAMARGYLNGVPLKRKR